MMNDRLAQAKVLKQHLLEFVFGADGALAEALERWSAKQSAQLSQSQFQQGGVLTDFVVDSFITQSKQGQPIAEFLQQHPDLSPEEQQLLQSWERSFLGLFEIDEKTPEGYLLLRNWLTAQSYRVYPNGSESPDLLKRMQPRGILMSRISPLDSEHWFLSGPNLFLGALGKPKLAMAVGNFKRYHPDSLYEDAPELLEEAWRSVVQHYRDFVDYFGSDRLTLPGPKLSQQLTAFQDALAQQKMDQAGVDEQTSIQELAQKSGTNLSAVEEAAENVGANLKTVSSVLQSQGKPRMAPIELEVPEHLRRAEQVTLLVHPEWGQAFLDNYAQIQSLLTELPVAVGDRQTELTQMLHALLSKSELSPYVWYHFAQEMPQNFSAAFAILLQQPNWQSTELPQVLESFGHRAEPVLPEVANLPVHLNELFQTAMLDLTKGRAKNKKQAKKKQGFG